MNQDKKYLASKEKAEDGTSNIVVKSTNDRNIVIVKAKVYEESSVLRVINAHKAIKEKRELQLQ